MLTQTEIGPVWSSYSTIYQALSVNVNNYPVTSMFGNNTTGIAQAITGAIDVPSSSAAGNASFGVAGYARSSSTSQGAVGVFGAGCAGATGVSIWGMNGVASNAASVNPANGQGHDNCTIYGCELDFNVKKVGSTTPNFALLGIYSAGDSESEPAGGLAASVRFIDLDSYGINLTPKARWNDGFYTRDGAAHNGINLGALREGNGQGSQYLVMRSTNASGTAKQCTISSDPDGNLSVNAAAGSIIGLNNPVFAPSFTGFGSDPTITGGTGAGTGATFIVDGNDASGVISVTTGTTPTTNATVLTFAFTNFGYLSSPNVSLTAANAATALAMANIYADTAPGHVDILVGATALAAATTYKWYYVVCG